MKIIRLGVLFLIVFIAPLLIGYPFSTRKDRHTYRLLPAWCAGWALLYAISYVTGLAGIFLGWTLDTLTVVWVFAVSAFCLLSISLMIRRKDSVFQNLFQSLKSFSVYEAAALLMTIGHALVTFFYMHIDDDDIAYVGAVTTSVDTNSLMKYDAVTGRLLSTFNSDDMLRLVTAPLFTFYAVVSTLVDVRPAPLCHTFLPPFFTVLFFAVLALCASELYPGDHKKCGIFLCFVFLAAGFSYVSVYTAGTFLMIRSWQGKAQIVGFVLPLLMYLYLRCRRKNTMEPGDFFLLVCLLSSACLMTTMGAMLCALTAFTLSAACAFMIRKSRVLQWTIAAELIPASSIFLYLFLRR